MVSGHYGLSILNEKLLTTLKSDFDLENVTQFKNVSMKS